MTIKKFYQIFSLPFVLFVCIGLLVGNILHPGLRKSGLGLLLFGILCVNFGMPLFLRSKEFYSFYKNDAHFRMSFSRIHWIFESQKMVQLSGFIVVLIGILVVLLTILYFIVYKFI